MDNQPKTSAELGALLKNLQSYAFQQAKRWSAIVLGIQLFLFAAGVVAIFWERASITYPWFTLGLAIVGVAASLRSTHFKGRGELLKRQQESLDGLGAKPSVRALLNLRAEIPTDLEPRVQQLLNKGITYASEAEPGLHRLLENLCESAYFSHQLARLCAIYLLILIFLALVGSFVVLVFCLENLHAASDAVIAARAVAATVIFLLSVGTVRSFWGYWSFSQRSDSILGEAEKLFKIPAPDACEAHRVLAEYQVARAGAPMIPTWLWKRERKRLDENWKNLNPTKP